MATDTHDGMVTAWVKRPKYKTALDGTRIALTEEEKNDPRQYTMVPWQNMQIPNAFDVNNFVYLHNDEFRRRFPDSRRWPEDISDPKTGVTALPPRDLGVMETDVLRYMHKYLDARSFARLNEVLARTGDSFDELMRLQRQGKYLKVGPSWTNEILAQVLLSIPVEPLGETFGIRLEISVAAKLTTDIVEALPTLLRQSRKTVDGLRFGFCPQISATVFTASISTHFRSLRELSLVIIEATEEQDLAWILFVRRIGTPDVCPLLELLSLELMGPKLHEELNPVVLGEIFDGCEHLTDIRLGCHGKEESPVRLTLPELLPELTRSRDFPLNLISLHLLNGYVLLDLTEDLQRYTHRLINLKDLSLRGTHYAAQGIHRTSAYLIRLLQYLPNLTRLDILGEPITFTTPLAKNLASHKNLLSLAISPLFRWTEPAESPITAAELSTLNRLTVFSDARDLADTAQRLGVQQCVDLRRYYDQNEPLGYRGWFQPCWLMLEGPGPTVLTSVNILELSGFWRLVLAFVNQKYILVDVSSPWNPDRIAPPTLNILTKVVDNVQKRDGLNRVTIKPGLFTSYSIFRILEQRRTPREEREKEQRQRGERMLIMSDIEFRDLVARETRSPMEH
jgi:hypothetical protein